MKKADEMNLQNVAMDENYDPDEVVDEEEEDDEYYDENEDDDDYDEDDDYYDDEYYDDEYYDEETGFNMHHIGGGVYCDDDGDNWDFF